jgi:hypothetical protein
VRAVGGVDRAHPVRRDDLWHRRSVRRADPLALVRETGQVRGADDHRVVAAFRRQDEVPDERRPGIEHQLIARPGGIKGGLQIVALMHSDGASGGRHEVRVEEDARQFRRARRRRFLVLRRERELTADREHERQDKTHPASVRRRPVFAG